LLSRPSSAWIRRDVEVQHAAAIEAEHDENLQQAERGRRVR
jgi:hypothetical protein